MLIPVYEDESDKKSSPYSLPNVEPFTWQWLSTINRVNSQVQKVRLCRIYSCNNSVMEVNLVVLFVRLADGWMGQTLILAYVTIPAMERISKEVLGSPACFEHYSIREIALRRFIPARMRD